MPFKLLKAGDSFIHVFTNMPAQSFVLVKLEKNIEIGDKKFNTVSLKTGEHLFTNDSDPVTKLIK